MPIFVFGK